MQDFNMVAEENNTYVEKPVVTGNEGKTMSIILSSMKDASVPFKNASKQPDLCLPLNENQLTQIYVEQVEVKIKPYPNIGVKNQYSDIFLGTKGIPDFYFHKVEEGHTHRPLLVVESKRLPAPEKSREKEYVIGNCENGGIERFKTEKHGKGFTTCGMLGFVEKETFDYWGKTVNKWITTLSVTNNSWNEDEILVEVEKCSDYSVLNSIVHRLSSEDASLYHLWINIPLDSKVQNFS
jgi:hypothetical protein